MGLWGYNSALGVMSIVMFFELSPVSFILAILCGKHSKKLKKLKNRSCELIALWNDSKSSWSVWNAFTYSSVLFGNICVSSPPKFRSQSLPNSHGRGDHP